MNRSTQDDWNYLVNVMSSAPARLDLKAAEEIIFGPGVDSLSRIYAIAYFLSPPRMDRSDWLHLVGSGWSLCDNPWRCREDLKRLLGTQGPLVEMMTGEEIVEYEKLPERVTIYRGAGKRRRMGASWTLSRDIAAKFCYRTTKPMLYTAVARKNQILAVKLDRAEREVITFSARVTRREAVVLKW